MISDDPRYQSTKVTRRKQQELHARYSDAQKLEAVKLFLVIGNNAQVCATLGINLPAWMYWKKQKWFKDLVEDLRREDSIQLSSRLKDIVKKSFSLVEDRIENGDYIYDQKLGKLIRKPMQGKDVARIASDFLDKAIKLEQKPREEEDQVLGRLEDLAKKFEELAAKKAPVKVTDVMYLEK